MGILPTVPKTAQEAAGMAVDTALESMPLGLGQLVPHNVRTDLKKTAAEASTQSGWFGDLLKSIFAFIQEISDWMDGKKTELRAAIDKNGATAETTLLARIGQTHDGKAQGTNPFAAIDQTFAIEVAGPIQQAAADTIKQASNAGFTSSKPITYEAALAFHNAALGIYKKALMKKYGTAAADEAALIDVAENLASTVSGISTAIATAQDPSLWLEKNPPQSGLAGLLINTHTVASKAPADGLTASQIDGYKPERSTIASASAQLAQFQAEAQKRIAATTQAAAQPAAAAGVTQSHGAAPVLPPLVPSFAKTRS